MDIPFLSIKDVVFFGPMQLETMMSFYSFRLLEISGMLLDNLNYIGRHPLTTKIKDASLGDLYEILDTSQSLDLLCDIDKCSLAALCHNYKILSDAIRHYNDTHPFLDNVLIRRRLLGQLPSLN